MSKIKPRRAGSNTKGVTVAFDVPMLNVLIKFSRCEFVSATQLSNLNKLLSKLDMETYVYNQDIYDRVRLLHTITEAIVDKGMRDDDALEMYINAHVPDLLDLKENIGLGKNRLSNSECKEVADAVNERLQYIEIYRVKDSIVNALENFDRVGFTSYYDIVNSMKSELSKLMVALQDACAPDSLVQEFNFSGERYHELLTKILQRAKKPSTVLMTGIRQLNANLSPGFEGGRLYLFLGGTGKFKSGTLWNMVDQMRQYNPQIKAVEDGMRKCILFITMENTINETILRTFDMYNDMGKEFKDCTPEEVEQVLRENGKFAFTDDNGIDIEMRYFQDLTINTTNISTIIEELADCGKKVIALTLDYILKLDSTRDNNNDERMRISMCARELKSLAQFYDIPVITAMQTNREGNSIIESAARDNMDDVGKFLGSSLVGNCFNLIQESDFVFMINHEMKKSTGMWLLSFKCTKHRGKKDINAATYFNHPFVNNNGIRLMPDVDLPEPVSIISAASDLISVDDTKEETSKQQRPRASASKQASNNILQSIDLTGMINKVA